MDGDTPAPAPVNIGESQKTDTGNVNPPSPTPEVKPSVQSDSTNTGTIAPVAPQSSIPTPEPGSVPLSDSQISNGGDSLLAARSAKIDEELANVSPTETQTYVDSNGVTQTRVWENPKYGELVDEKERIKEEQEDRAENRALGISNNQNNNIA